MLDRPLLAVVIVCGMMSGFGGVARGQAPDGTPFPTVPAGQQSGKARPTPKPTADENPGPMITVEFAGGTAKQFVDAVRDAGGGSGGARINVIMPKEAEGVAIPAVSLREVTAFTALQALEYSAPAEGGYQFAVNAIGASSEPSRTFAVRYANRFPNQGMMQPQYQPPPARQETRVFSLRELVEAPASLATDPAAVTSTETVVNALRAASQIDAEAKSPVPELMLHKDSQLLIVRATNEQLRTMESVLQQLTGTVMNKRAQAMEAAQKARAEAVEQAEFKTQLEFTREQIERSGMEMEKAAAQLDQLQRQAAPKQPPHAESQIAQHALNGATQRREQAISKMRMLEEQAAVSKARTQAGGDAQRSGEFPVAVQYNFQDLKAFDGDVYAICRAIVPSNRDSTRSSLKVNSPGSIVFRATPGEQRILVTALNAMRRAKANEPDLPGQDAADVIRKNEVK